MNDTLVVKGLGRADGEYPIRLMELIGLNHPDSLTTRELNAIKVMTSRASGGDGTRAGELLDAVVNADAATLVALTCIVLARNDKPVAEDRVWDCRILFSVAEELPPLDDFKKAILFHVHEEPEDKSDLEGVEQLEDDATDPPEQPPVTEA